MDKEHAVRIAPFVVPVIVNGYPIFHFKFPEIVAQLPCEDWPDDGTNPPPIQVNIEVLRVEVVDLLTRTMQLNAMMLDGESNAN